MNNASELAQENDALRERLSLLSEASLRINESLRSRLPAIMDLRKPPSQGSLPAPCTGGRVPGLRRCEGRHPPSPSVSDPAGPVPGWDACLTRSLVCACFPRGLLLARTADGNYQRVGPHPAVSGADGSSAAQPLMPATGPPECLCGTSGSARPDRPH